jgi:hypothetical protein
VNRLWVQGTLVCFPDIESQRAWTGRHQASRHLLSAATPFCEEERSLGI